MTPKIYDALVAMFDERWGDWAGWAHTVCSSQSIRSFGDLHGIITGTIHGRSQGIRDVWASLAVAVTSSLASENRGGAIQRPAGSVANSNKAQAWRPICD